MINGKTFSFLQYITILILFGSVLADKQDKSSNQNSRLAKYRTNIAACDKIKEKCKRQDYKTCLAEQDPPAPKICFSDDTLDNLRCRVVTCYDKTKVAKGYLDGNKQCVCGSNPNPSGDLKKHKGGKRNRKRTSSKKKGGAREKNAARKGGAKNN